MPLIIDRILEGRPETLEEANVRSGGRIIGTIQDGIEGAILCILKPDDRESIIATTSLNPEAAAVALMSNKLGDRRKIVAELTHGQSHEMKAKTSRDEPEEVLRFSHKEGRVAIAESIPGLQNQFAENTLAQILSLPEFFSQTDLPFKLHAPFAEIVLLRGKIPLTADQTQMANFIWNARGICAKYKLTNEEEIYLFGTLSQAIKTWFDRETKFQN